MAYTVCHAPIPMTSQICYRNNFDIDLKVTSSGIYFVKVLSTTGGGSIDAMVTDLCCHLTYDSRGAWHTVYAMLLSIKSGMLPEIHTMEKCDFLKFIIQSLKKIIICYNRICKV